MAWDSTMQIENDKKGRQMARKMAYLIYYRLMVGDTKESLKFSLGGLSVRQYVTHVSKKAWKEIKKVSTAVEQGKGVLYAKVQPEQMKITREHVVPVESLYKHLLTKKERGELSAEYIFSLIDKLEIALITPEENQKLSAAHLWNDMPEGWWDKPLQKRDPLERYRAAGLNDSIWETKFNL